ncbi:polynucleotide 5'-hydroxyl-kinase NOL9 [Aphomia sociella]
MEHFAKAHVAKKDSKTEGAMKKQLKQMLQGYKQSDIKLIRDSENLFVNPHKYFNEDSSSVSGFSDLNLTNSSNEGNISLGNVGSGFSTDKNNESPNITGLDDSTSISGNNVESLSESIKNIESLSEDLSLNSDESSQSDLIDNISMISSSIETGTVLDSDDSESFDANGELAAKIHMKLKKKESAKKRPANEINTEKHTRAKDVKDEKITMYVDSDDKLSLDDENASSPFVSITAADMDVDQSFSQVLGIYKHSTVNNMPSDIQTVIQSTKSASMFPIESMNVEECVVEANDVTYEYDNDEVIGAELDLSDECSNTLPEETSTNYDDTLQSELIFERESSTEQTDEFVNPVRIYNGHNGCVIVMKHPADIFIHGKVSVQLLGGKVDIFGYTLENLQCEVYAPNYNYAQQISTVENQNAYYGLFSKLTAAGLPVYEAEEIVTTIGEYDGVIRLSPLKSRKMDFVENNFKVADLFSKPSKNIEMNMKIASDLLGCSLYQSKPWKHFQSAVNWKPAIEYALDHRSRGIVCGGKGVGKSTYLRYSVNRLLSQGPVLVIDLDPGQAEFTVAGNISATIVTEPLLGPNFTHLRKPERMLNIGMINPMDNTRLYATAVSELIAYCSNNARFQTMPWIVNTMGMCNVMGLKFMLLTIIHTQPTYILQIDSKNAKKRFDCYLTPSTVKRLYSDYQHDRLFRNFPCSEDLEYTFFMADSLENTSKNNYSLSARDERYLNYLAYFGELLNLCKEESLLGITPYEVNYRELYIGLNVKVDKDAVLKVINGKVVALCQLTQDSNAKLFTLCDKPLLCHGHALIRGIDYAKELIYIITPYPNDLTLTNTLVYADWVPELRGQDKHLPEKIALPYRTATVHQQRELMFAPRRRFNPLQLLKMSRSA